MRLGRDDVDLTYRRAPEAGVEAPGDTPYGDRRAKVKDRWDVVWQIATYGQAA